MKKTVITYGLISGAISAILMVVMGTMLSNKIDFDKGMYVGYTGMLISFIVIYPAVVSYRKNVGGGTLSFGRALSIGLLITLISCVCYAITWLIVYNTMMPDFVEKYGAHMVEQVKKNGRLTQVQIDAKIIEIHRTMEWYKNPVLMFLITMMEPLPVGILISLVSAAIIKIKKRADIQPA